MNIFPSNESDEGLDHLEGLNPKDITLELDEDYSYVVLAQKGDQKAYEELVIRHRGKIYAMIKNMVHNEADAWDLSQEVFIKGWRALPRFEARSRFSTWLYRIAHNTVYDFCRRQKKQLNRELYEETFDRENLDSSAKISPTAIDSPDDALSHQELRIKIEIALSKLSVEHREVVLLKDVQGLAYKEIADVMNCSIGTVMSRLFYARQKLQVFLKDEYESR